MIPALSTTFTALSAGAVGWGLGTGDTVVLASGLVGLVCALPLQDLSYRVYTEEHHTCRTPHHVLWYNPYNNDWKEQG